VGGWVGGYWGCNGAYAACVQVLRVSPFSLQQKHAHTPATFTLKHQTNTHNTCPPHPSPPAARATRGACPAPRRARLTTARTSSPSPPTSRCRGSSTGSTTPAPCPTSTPLVSEVRGGRVGMGPGGGSRREVGDWAKQPLAWPHSYTACPVHHRPSPSPLPLLLPSL
jgi:hypothetical protein